ncbi:hypothetical protein ACQZ4U_18900, partial [Agrobacterium vitis]
DFAYERLIGTHADLSLNPGKFQLPLAQNPGALHAEAKAQSEMALKMDLGGCFKRSAFPGCTAMIFNSPYSLSEKS